MGTSKKIVGTACVPGNVTEPSQLVYVIDDDVAVRRSLHFVLSTAGYTSWPFACAFDFLDNLPNLQPAPILLDIRMPEIGGIDLMTEVLKREINWPIIIITGHADIPIAVQAIKHGAIDLLEKPLDFEMLQISLNTAMQKLIGLNAASKIQSDSRSLFSLLSARELQVIKFLMDGLPNKIAAHRLSLSVRTVEMHRANALQKLKVRSIAEVAHLARAAGVTMTGTRDV